MTDTESHKRCLQLARRFAAKAKREPDPQLARLHRATAETWRLRAACRRRARATGGRR